MPENRIFTRRLILELLFLAVLLLFVGHLRGRPQLPRRSGGPPEYRRLAKELIRSGDYPQAEAAIKKAIELDNGFARAYIDLGVIYTETGNYILAQSAYQRSLDYVGKDKVNREIANFNLGMAYYRERDAEESWVFLRRALAMNSYLNSPVYWKNSPDEPTYYVIHNDKTGFKRFFSELEGLPPEIHRLDSRIRDYYSRGNPDKVISLSLAYLEGNPDSYYTYLFLEHLASAFIRKAEYANSLAALQQLEDMSLEEKDAVWVRYTQAYNFYQLGKYRQALEYLSGIKKDFPDYYPGTDFYSLSRLILQQDRGGFTRELLANPDFPREYGQWLQYNLARIHYEQKRYSRALEILNGLLADRPSRGYEKLALQLKAEILYKERDSLSAEETLKQIVAIFPQSREARSAHYWLSRIYYEKGDFSASYLALFNSGLLAVNVALNFILLNLLGALIVFFIMGVSGLFFSKQKGPADRAYQFPAFDFFVFISLLLSLPWLFSLIILPLGFLTGRSFLSIGLRPEFIAVFLSDILLVSFCLWLLKIKYNIDNRTLGFCSRGLKYNLLLPLAVTLGSVFLAVIFSLIIHFSNAKVPQTFAERLVSNAFTDGNKWQVAYLFAMIAVIAPLSEEIIFRVFVLNFLKKHSNTVMAVVFSSLLFAFFHQSLILLPYFFLIGLVLALLYTRTKSIIPCIVTHGLYNFLFLMLSYLSAKAE
ncbi:MAG: CPBP family glutamic-type intramembrane protease [Candidatus Omnitrophica bacterium]|nr:CPBP family glutamic-type intramembrane protease [Candidatus Omnitrophota bacterium]